LSDFDFFKNIRKDDELSEKYLKFFRQLQIFVKNAFHPFFGHPFPLTY